MPNSLWRRKMYYFFIIYLFVVSSWDDSRVGFDDYSLREVNISSRI